MITPLSIKIKRLLFFGLASMLSTPTWSIDTSIAENLNPDLLLNTHDASEPIKAISIPQQTDARKLALGQKLFHEKRLDKNQRLSCASCHNLRFGGTNRRAQTRNNTGKITKFNTPSIFNVSLNAYYYWSGKFSSLQEQLDDALIDINSTWPYAIKQLTSIPEYREAFKAIYTEGITADTIKDAIIHFEESLTTPNAPFDRYLQGDSNAISINEKRGYQLFKTYGCITCHQGINIGGNFLLKINKQTNKADYSAPAQWSNRTGIELPYIRVPSLRNIARTAPYFHDGSARTLREAVNRMLKQYLGTNVPAEDIQLIVNFLNTLTGEYKGQSL